MTDITDTPQPGEREEMERPTWLLQQIAARYGASMHTLYSAGNLKLLADWIEVLEQDARDHADALTIVHMDATARATDRARERIAYLTRERDVLHASVEDVHEQLEESHVREIRLETEMKQMREAYDAMTADRDCWRAVAEQASANEEVADSVFLFWSTEDGAMPYVWSGTQAQVEAWKREAMESGSLRDVLAGPNARVAVRRWAIALIYHSVVVAARDWPDDQLHENGRYSSRCIACDNAFVGHKRRVMCRVCAKRAGVCGVCEDALPCPAHGYEYVYGVHSK